VLEQAPRLNSVERIRFALFDARALAVHERALRELRGEAE
jgi:hypothetical protein